MLVQSYFPRDDEAFRALFGLATADAGCIVMQAGHFLLYYDEKSESIVPCLNEEVPGSVNAHPLNNARFREFGQFPLLTWRLGLRALAALPHADKYVMVEDGAGEEFALSVHLSF